MTLKEFCTKLQQYADKLEEEIRYNINDIHNLVYSKKLNETKLALEKAKDYHYKEIMESIAEILKNVKKILFHQDKIEWLDNENNFTKDELRRFSYVKRQVFAFSNSEEVAPVPVPTHNSKKEIRRRASEVSIGTLEAWEKYVDQKDKGEKEMEEKVAELKSLVPKRTLSNARRRKKFVSSTMGGFLEGEERKKNLDSIFEDASSTEENDILSYSRSLESLDKLILGNEQNVNYDEIATGSKINENNLVKGFLESLHNMVCDNEISNTHISENNRNLNEVDDDDKDPGSLNSSLPNEGVELTTAAPINSSIINILHESMPKDEESIKEEIISTFLNDSRTPHDNITETENAAKPTKEKIKPKIVDVIYKKKPS